MKTLEEHLVGLAEDVLAFDTLDQLYDSLRLAGAVIGLKALVEIVLGSSDPKLRLAAAKELRDLKEDPEVIAERLRSSKLASLSMEELERKLEPRSITGEKHE